VISITPFTFQTIKFANLQLNLTPIVVKKLITIAWNVDYAFGGLHSHLCKRFCSLSKRASYTFL